MTISYHVLVQQQLTANVYTSNRSQLSSREIVVKITSSTRQKNEAVYTLAPCWYNMRAEIKGDDKLLIDLE